MMEKEGVGECEYGKGVLKVEERVGFFFDCVCVFLLYFILDVG